jgi:hypothetical protein
MLMKRLLSNAELVLLGLDVDEEVTSNAELELEHCIHAEADEGLDVDEEVADNASSHPC